MTVALLLLALALPGDRGGPAIGPDRGGHALPVIGLLNGEPVTLVRELPTFAAFVCIHNGEGRWNANTGNGYYGGLQMDSSFMHTYGLDMIERHRGGLAHTWTPAEQILVAHRAWLTRGFGPWPMTRLPCGV